MVTKVVCMVNPMEQRDGSKEFEPNPIVDGKSPTQKGQIFALACGPEELNTTDLMSLQVQATLFLPCKK